MSAQRFRTPYRKYVLHIVPAFAARFSCLTRIMAPPHDRPRIHRHPQLTCYAFGYILRLVVSTVQPFPYMQRHRHDDIHIGIQSPSAQFATVPFAHTQCRQPATAVFESVYQITITVAVDEIYECRSVDYRHESPELAHHRIIDLCPKSRQRSVVTATVTNLRSTFSELSSAHRTHRRPEKLFQISTETFYGSYNTAHTLIYTAYPAPDVNL